MKFLLTNDDGIDAPGLAALERAVAGLGTSAVIAPIEQFSGCGHQVNHHRPLAARQLAEDRHAVDGTPADCTRLGLLHLAAESDWVLAGINDGGNLGVDVYMSGTVAAVREAALLGRPGAAFSQYNSGGPRDWTAAARQVRRVLAELLPYPLEPGAFWNVNLPDAQAKSPTPEIVFCPLETSHLHVRYEFADGMFHYRGDYHSRPRQPGSDVDVCFSGHIAVTQVLPTGSLAQPPANGDPGEK